MFTWAIIDDARDRHTAPGIARRSRLASGNCGTQPWGPAAKCEFISARALSAIARVPTTPYHRAIAILFRLGMLCDVGSLRSRTVSDAPGNLHDQAIRASRASTHIKRHGFSNGA